MSSRARRRARPTARGVRHDIEVAVRVRRHVVDRRRDAAVVHREDGRDRLDAARAGREVARHRLGRGDGDAARVRLAQRELDGDGLGAVVVGRAGAVAVDVVDVGGRGARRPRSRGASRATGPRRPGRCRRWRRRTSRRRRARSRCARRGPCADSSDSSMRTPAPSPRTKPSRLRSNGREACSGSLLLCESAPMRPIEASASGVMIASAPPASSARACPRRMRFSAWPSASVPEAQAVLIVVFGPRMPSSRPTRPAPMCWPMRVMTKGSARCAPFGLHLRPGLAHLERAAGGGHHDADIVTARAVEVEAAVVERLLRGGVGELREASGAARRLPFEVELRVPVLHLAGDLHGQRVGVGAG